MLLPNTKGNLQFRIKDKILTLGCLDAYLGTIASLPHHCVLLAFRLPAPTNRRREKNRAEYCYLTNDLRAEEKMKETQRSCIRIPQAGCTTDCTAGGRSACTSASMVAAEMAPRPASLPTTQANEAIACFPAESLRDHHQESVDGLAQRPCSMRTLHKQLRNLLHIWPTVGCRNCFRTMKSKSLVDSQESSRRYEVRKGVCPVRRGGKLQCRI